MLKFIVVARANGMLQNLDSPVQWFLVLLLVFVIFFLVGCVAQTKVERALENPKDRERVYLEQLPFVSELASAGIFRIRLFEQNGELQAEHEASCASSALSKAMASFRQANIDAVRIRRNTTDELHFHRLICRRPGSCARSELGWIEIDRVVWPGQKRW